MCVVSYFLGHFKGIVNLLQKGFGGRSLCFQLEGKACIYFFFVCVSKTPFGARDLFLCSDRSNADHGSRLIFFHTKNGAERSLETAHGLYR